MKKWIAANALLVTATTLSICWIIGAIYLVSLTATGPSWPKSLNEWGDYVAGAAAPLAFLWLVVAVLLQTKELQAQREELELTRDELKEQRIVLAAQATEARRHADFAKAQTDILQEESQNRRMMAVVGEFDEVVADMRGILRGFEGPFYLGTVNLHTGDSLFHGVNFNTTEEIIRSFADQLATKMDGLRPSDYKFSTLPRQAADLVALTGLTTKAIDLANAPSGAGLRLAAAARLRLAELKSALDLIEPDTSQ